MEEIKIRAAERNETGSAEARRVRGGDMIPAVVYGKDMNRSLKIDSKELKYLRQHHFSENVIINLEIEKDGKKDTIPTLLKDYQIHPVKEELLHLDFVKVSMTKKVTVEVPVETEGDAKGVKEGGALEQVLWNVEVECLPRNIPENIVVDISELEVNESIHVKDIKVEEGVEVLSNPDDVIVTIVPPAQVEKPEEEAAAEEEEPEVTEEKASEEGEAEGGEKEEASEKEGEKQAEGKEQKDSEKKE